MCRCRPRPPSPPPLACPVERREKARLLTPRERLQFDSKCLDFVLDFFATARDAFYGTPGDDGPRRDLSFSSPLAQSNMQNPLFLKQAIIVLREELEYFAIPPSRKEAVAAAAATGTAPPPADDAAHPATDELGKPNAALSQLKIDCGNALLEHRSIFTALQRNVSRDNNVAEQHLIDMLCMRCVLYPFPIVQVSLDQETHILSIPLQRL